MGKLGGALCLLSSILAVGCGDSTAEVSTGPTTTVTESVEVSRPEPDKATPSEAVAYVARYYDLLDAKQFGRAWPLLPKVVQQETGGYDLWREGQHGTLSTHVDQARLVKATKVRAVVEVSLTARDINVCEATIEQTFAGNWYLRDDGGDWEPDHTAIEKTGGPDPAVATNCELEGDMSEPEPLSSAPSCVDGYSQCLDPTASDYDCEGGEGDGPQYVIGPISVTGSDPFELDLDGNGVGCEPI